MEIVNYIEESLSSMKISFDCENTEHDNPHIRVRYIVIFEDTTFVFETTPFYVQIKMNDSIFLYGNGVHLIDFRVVRHYALAFLRLIQTNGLVFEFNEECKTARIDMNMGPQNPLQYNLPVIHLDLFLKKEEKGCHIHRHLISEKYWVPPSNEGYPLSDNPLSADNFYYQSVSKGIMSIPLSSFHASCHFLVNKML